MKVAQATVKKLVQNGVVQFLVGTLIGSGVMYLYENRHTLLVLTDQDVRELKVNADYAVYDTKHGPIFVGMRAVTEGA